MVLSSAQRSKAAKKAAKTKKRKKDAASNSRRGKNAWANTIDPSHDKYQEILQKEFKNKLVRKPRGLPDFVVHTKTTRFEELKPNRYADGSLAPADGRYLNENQENTIREMLDEGVSQIFIVYYNQKKSKFIFQRKKLTKKNLFKFCFTTSADKRFNADELF